MKVIVKTNLAAGVWDIKIDNNRKRTHQTTINIKTIQLFGDTEMLKKTWVKKL